MSETETETTAGRPGRVVTGEAVVDLSHFTEPEQLAVFSRIERAAVVIVPEALAAAYAAIPTAKVASTLNLDDDLAAWAASVRLPAADADAIFRRIVSSPAGPAAVPAWSAPDSSAPAAAPPLSPSWWRGYNAGFAARMVASTAPVRVAA